MFRKWSYSKKLIVHILFWIGYYLLFGFIWAKNNDYKASFNLEFVLLPVRITCVYVTVLFLLPEFLLKKKLLKFVIFYILLLLVSGLVQRTFMYFFLEGFSNFDFSVFFNISSIFRAIILINTTVLFVASIYILNSFYKEKERNLTKERILKLKSNRRIYSIKEHQILHIESLGNYVNYFLNDATKIVVYKSLKECLNELSSNFIRIHKSHIINKKQVKSFSKENVELISGEIIPIGVSANISDTEFL